MNKKRAMNRAHHTVATAEAGGEAVRVWEALPRAALVFGSSAVRLHGTRENCGFAVV
jgi:hypothetical protein